MMTTRWLLAVWLSLIIWSPVLAAGSVEEMMQDIMMGQGVSEQEQINCKEMNEDEWEKLGDAVMNEMINDDEQHELMDEMMGGEGSESLRAMNINMGQQYLGCGEGMGMDGMTSFRSGLSAGRQGSLGMMNMMSGFGGTGMMGLGGGGMLAFWALVIVVIGLFIAWLNRKQNSASSSKTALDILKERYARGEIDKKEFETKKRDLTK